MQKANQKIDIEKLQLEYPIIKESLCFSAQDLAKACGYNLQKDSLSISKELESNITKYYTELEQKLPIEEQRFEDEKSEHFLQDLQHNHAKVTTNKEFKTTLDSMQKYNPKLDNSFYKNKQQELKDKDKKELYSLHKHALNSWQKIINEKIANAQKNIIQQEQNELINRVKEWIELIRKSKETIDNLGDASNVFGDEIMQELKAGLASGQRANASGGGAGNSAGNLQKSALNFQKYLQLLNTDSIKELCDMLGRLQKEEKTKQLEKYTAKETYNTKIKTKKIKEEISGVTLGRDLENVLPQELALLDDPDFSILFDLKFAENRLFCFEKQGYKDITKTKEIELEREIEISEEKGPIILCIDTSGSMSGTPENIAKVVALYMAKHAKKQNRACYLISFSTDIYTLDLTPPNGISKLMSFLEMSFHGGTDPFPAIKEGFQKMQEENYKKADMLIISDFVFSRGEGELKQLMEQKDEENKCYALYIGNFHQSECSNKIFDDEFIFDGSNSIRQLREAF